MPADSLLLLNGTLPFQSSDSTCNSIVVVLTKVLFAQPAELVLKGSLSSLFHCQLVVIVFLKIEFSNTS
jgi:hypothetical protein